MTSHELARLLLTYPDEPVYVPVFRWEDYDHLEVNYLKYEDGQLVIDHDSSL